jgi:hypothetical protein
MPIDPLARGLALLGRFTGKTGGNTAASRKVALAASSGTGIYDVAAVFTKMGQSGSGGKSALDLEVPFTGGNALRVWNRDWSAKYPPTSYPDIPWYLNARAHQFMQTSLTVSGTWTGTGDNTAITQPTNDQYMIGIWSDITDAALAIRTNNAAGNYAVQGFDGYGNYRWRIEADGTIKWGNSATKAAEDISLTRSATGPRLSVAGGSFILANNQAYQIFKSDGTTAINILAIDASNAMSFGSGSLGGNVVHFASSGKEWRLLNNNSTKYLLRAKNDTLALYSDGGFTSAHATQGIGYATGAGGTVDQATSKSTGVTLNKVSGKITLNAAALADSTTVAFTFTNSAIAATDTISLNIASGATSGAYIFGVEAVAAGSCRIFIRNMSGGSLSESVVFNFNVLKGVTS